MLFTRTEASLSAWALALAAGESLRNSAIDRGIHDATGGKVFSDSRVTSDNRACYALGWALGRFTLLNKVRHHDTMGDYDHKAALLATFANSPEGRAYRAEYRLLID